MYHDGYKCNAPSYREQKESDNTLLLFTIGGGIAFVAIMIHNGCNERRCSSIFWANFYGVSTCGLLFATTLFYIVLVDNGLKSAGMGGLILSLIPPFAGGLIINKICQ